MSDLRFEHHFKVLDSDKKQTLGVRAVVAYFLKGKEIFRDQLNLYSAKDRARFLLTSASEGIGT